MSSVRHCKCKCKTFLLRPLQVDRGRITKSRPILKVTSLPKVIWEEGRVAALSHTYTVKSYWLQWRARNSPPKVLLTVDRSPNPTTCLIPWTRPTYNAKRHPDLIRCFSTMHWTARQTDAQTDRSSTEKFDHYRPLRLSLIHI